MKKTFAVMSGTTVENIIVADDDSVENILDSTLIEISSSNPAGVGWTYDKESGNFVAPVAIEPDTTEDAP